MQKGLSLITNFGCKTNCEYCIWKDHIFNSINQNIFTCLYVLNNEIKKEKIEKFSISGGGDPFNNVSSNIQFWNEINKICKENNVKVDIHSSYLNFKKDFIKYNNIYQELKSNTNRIVLHLSVERYDENKIFDISREFKLRINFVVTNKLSLTFLNKVEEYSKKLNIQLAYRELMFNESIKPTEELSEFCKSIHKRYKNGRYVYQNDYNRYIMPNGKLYENFLSKG